MVALLTPARRATSSMLMVWRPWSNRSSIAAVRIALWAFSLRGRPGVRVFSAVLVTRRPSRAVDRASIFAVVGGSMFGEQHTFAEGEDLHVTVG
jgi:hypothetical protein